MCGRPNFSSLYRYINFYIHKGVLLFFTFTEGVFFYYTNLLANSHIENTFIDFVRLPKGTTSPKSLMWWEIVLPS